MKIFRTTALLAASAILFSLSSCTDEEKNGSIYDSIEDLWIGELADVPNADECEMYDFSHNAYEIKSIEFFPNGEYVLTYENQYDYKPARLSMLKKKAGTRNYCYYKYGKFTKTGENSYNVEGVGAFVFDGNKCFVTFNDNIDHHAVEFSVSKNLNLVESNALNNRLCRMWTVVRGQIAYYDVNSGNLVYVREIKFRKELEDNFIHSMIVSRNNTFIQFEWDGEVDEYGRWSWQNAAQQVLRYDWLEDDGYEIGGVTQIVFNNEYAMFSELVYDEYDEFECDDDYDDPAPIDHSKRYNQMIVVTTKASY